jgi:hypothetical protein
VLGALGKAPIALGKKNLSAKVSLASVTYRALCKAFVECHISTRQKKLLSSTLTTSLSSATLISTQQKKSAINSDGLFAECDVSDTRQRSFFLKKIFAEYQSFALGEEHFYFF